VDLVARRRRLRFPTDSLIGPDRDRPAVVPRGVLEAGFGWDKWRLSVNLDRADFLYGDEIVDVQWRHTAPWTPAAPALRWDWCQS
jgi:hypothetical protein